MRAEAKYRIGEIFTHQTIQTEQRNADRYQQSPEFSAYDEGRVIPVAGQTPGTGAMQKSLITNNAIHPGDAADKLKR